MKKVYENTIAWLKEVDFPLITRRWHEKILAEQVGFLKTKKVLDFRERQLASQEKDIDAFLKRISKLEIWQDGKPPFTIEVAFAIDPHALMELAGTMENHHHIEQRRREIAFRFARYIERELATINFATLPHYREIEERRRAQYSPSPTEPWNY